MSRKGVNDLYVRFLRNGVGVIPRAYVSPMRRCTKCGELKPRNEFYPAKGGRDGLRGDCKPCFAARAKRWYRENSVHVIARVKAWQQANPERLSATRKVTRARRRDIDRDAYLKRTFGIGSPEYEAMLSEQGGVCMICGRPPRKGSSLHVDHDHETGEVRGLLCFRCNGGLGQFKEDGERLVTASEYLSGDLEPIGTRTLFRGMSVARARRLSSVSG